MTSTNFKVVSRKELTRWRSLVDVTLPPEWRDERIPRLFLSYERVLELLEQVKAHSKNPARYSLPSSEIHTFLRQVMEE